jgi:hypothetical protein
LNIIIIVLFRTISTTFAISIPGVLTVLAICITDIVGAILIFLILTAILVIATRSIAVAIFNAECRIIAVTIVIATLSIAVAFFTAGIGSIFVFFVIELSERCKNISGLLVVIASHEGFA